MCDMDIFVVWTSPDSSNSLTEEREIWNKLQYPNKAVNFPSQDEFKHGLKGCLEETEPSDRKPEWMNLKLPPSLRLPTPCFSPFQEASLSMKPHFHSSSSCLITMSKLVDCAWANASIATLTVYLLQFWLLFLLGPHSASKLGLYHLPEWCALTFTHRAQRTPSEKRKGQANTACPWQNSDQSPQLDPGSVLLCQAACLLGSWSSLPGWSWLVGS